MTTRRGSRSLLVQDTGRERPARLDCTNDFGLTPRELRAEIARCIDAGWRGWEIRHRFGCTPCKEPASD